MQVNQYPVISTLSDTDDLLVQTASDGAYKSMPGSVLKAYVGSSIPSAITYAQVGDVKSSGTNGGTYSSAVNITRTLNTVITSASWLSLNTSTSVITLASGTYLVDGFCTAGGIGSFRCWLANASTNAVLLLGSSAYPNTNYYAACLSLLKGQIILSASTTLTMQMKATNTSSNTSALGVASGITGQTELYSQIGFTKIA